MDKNRMNGFFDDENTEASEQAEMQETSAEAEIVEQMPGDEAPKTVTIEADDADSYYLYDDALPQETPTPKREKKQFPALLLTAILTSIFTAAICCAIFFFAGPQSKSTIIYRDGNDLRSKVDLMQSLGLKDAEEGKPLSVTAVESRVGPTVVGIAANGTATAESFFGMIEQPFSSSGTGFIVSTDGYIVTNNHVIQNAKEIIVTLNNDQEYTATVIGADAKTDLAVLKIDADGLTPAVLGNSSAVQVGEVAIAIGNPLGQTLSGTVTAGIISATNRKVTVDGNEYTLLQTDAAINSGNSGGPLANAYGEVIGINNAKIAASGVEGLGFAIPADIAKPVIEDLIAVGYVRGRPLIGINGRNITEDISKYYDLPIGIYVVSVVEFSAAENAGVQIGDVITHCNGKKVETVEALNEIRDEHASGDVLTLTIIRKGKRLELPLTLGEDKPSVSLN